MLRSQEKLMSDTCADIYCINNVCSFTSGELEHNVVIITISFDLYHILDES